MVPSAIRHSPHHTVASCRQNTVHPHLLFVLLAPELCVMKMKHSRYVQLLNSTRSSVSTPTNDRCSRNWPGRFCRGQQRLTSCGNLQAVSVLLWEQKATGSIWQREATRRSWASMWVRMEGKNPCRSLDAAVQQAARIC